MKLKLLLIFMFLTVSVIPVGIIGGFIGFELISLALICLIIALTFGVSLVIAHFITRPLAKLTKNIDEISKGNLDVQLEKSEIYEINKLTSSLNRVMTSLKLAIHKVGVKKGEIFEETIKAKEQVEEKYQSLLKNLDGWVCEIDGKGIHAGCSAKIYEALGYKPEEILGKSIFDLMTPDGAKIMKTKFSDSTKCSPIKNLELWLKHKNGGKVCILLNADPVFDETGKFKGYRGIVHDITNYKNAKKTIENLNEKISEMKSKQVKDVKITKKTTKTHTQTLDFNLEDKWTKHEFDSVFLFDEQANVVDCTENMYKNLGYTKGEMLSLNVTDFDALQTKNDMKTKIDTVKKKGSIDFKTIHKRKDGSVILVRENLSYIKDKKLVKCIVTDES